MAVRLKVARVIKLNAFDRAFSRTNPFNLNEKDKKALRNYLRIINELFKGE